MKREARDFREKMPRPVQRIPLAEGSLRRRGIGVALALLAAGLALFISLRTLTRVDEGWTQIEADTAKGPAGEVAFWAELGAGTESPLTERRFLTGVYSDAARELHTLFNPYEIAAGVNNIWWINHHPDEEIPVDPRLYQALRHAVSMGREVYFGPVYELWDSVYFSETDQEARQADPRLDPETGKALTALMGYLSKEEHISLSFPAENTVCLHLSEALRECCEDYGLSRCLDLGWMTNAYITDMLAEVLLDRGWTKGILASPDGYVRCLGEGTYTLEVLAARNGRAVRIAGAEYTGPAAILQMIPVPGGSRARFYRYGDGTLRSPWISPEDGLDRIPVENLSLISRTDGCRDLLKPALQVLLEEIPPEEAPDCLAGKGCSFLAVRGNQLYGAGEEFRLKTAEPGLQVQNKK